MCGSHTLYIAIIFLNVLQAISVIQTRLLHDFTLAMVWKTLDNAANTSDKGVSLFYFILSRF